MTTSPTQTHTLAASVRYYPAAACIAIVYLAILVTPWVLTCLDNTRRASVVAGEISTPTPPEAPTAINALNAVATASAIPVIVALLSRSAAVLSQRTHHRQTLNVRQLFNLQYTEFQPSIRPVLDGLKAKQTADYSPLRDPIGDNILGTYHNPLRGKGKPSLPYFVSLNPRGTNTGLARNHGMRLNSTVSCREIAMAGAQLAFASLYSSPNMAVDLCIPGASPSLWRAGRDKQSEAETMRIEIANHEPGHFPRLPNCPTSSAVENNTVLPDPFRQPGPPVNATNRPLMLTAKALFGPRFLFATATNATNQEGNAPEGSALAALKNICIRNTVPFSRMVDLGSDCDRVTTEARSDAQFSAGLGMAVFAVNKALITEALGVSLGGMIFLSIPVGLQALGIILLVVHIYSVPTWTETLDALAIARVAHQIDDQGQGALARMALGPPPNDKIVLQLYHIDALVGGVAEDDGGREMMPVSSAPRPPGGDGHILASRGKQTTLEENHLHMTSSERRCRLRILQGRVPPHSWARPAPSFLRC
ncbi:hypothetical protein B0H63DRAFT_510903 [Podospora didyma]|uniref:Uncharacterized protein n=1 Tax=Podospora didyma TaxID=330526 RepID=A0AAE0NGD9_9PEZI|nr:hypothetical protein B0H63DRAFT_510903 [Podospora didyma]